LEILLDSNGLCNLTTVNVFAFVKDNKLDIKSLLEAQKLSARSGYRMTCVELELPKWDAVQQRDKLTGCSLTGWQDMVNATKMSKIDEIDLLKKLRQVAHEEINTYSQELGLPNSLLVTTCKPEGTLSQLPGVTSGIHYSESPLFIRRVRINAHDPLVKVCEELGYPIFPEVGQTMENCTTKVIEFPMKSTEGKTKYDVSAIEQLENYKMFMDNYVDHNASITVTVRDHEWGEVEKWIYNNWDDIVAVSFLPLSNSFYQLMPYEAITEEEYNKRVKEMKPFIPSLISKYEKEEVEFDIGNDGCESGVCPVR
jgi:ribonucleoside-diphosphate reductase alpha chain/ribonucleoside-triphosphate reductase